MGLTAADHMSSPHAKHGFLISAFCSYSVPTSSNILAVSSLECKEWLSQSEFVPLCMSYNLIIYHF